MMLNNRIPFYKGTQTYQVLFPRENKNSNQTNNVKWNPLELIELLQNTFLIWSS